MAWTIYPITFGLALLAGLFVAVFGSSFRKRALAGGPELGLRAALPGHDCGLCGSYDCKGFARLLVSGSGDPGRCLPGGGDTESRLRALLGEKRAKPQVAVLRCSGDDSSAARLFAYEGARDCLAATRIHGGPKACGEACLGLGSCVPLCPLEAIRVEKGLAIIDPELCTGCGLCVEACPPRVIHLLPRDRDWYIACNSTRPPAEKVAVCRSSCTACGECERHSDEWQFALQGNLAAFTGQAGLSDKGIAAAAAVCPTSVIRHAGAESRRRKSS